MDEPNRSYQPDANLPRPQYETVGTLLPAENDANAPKTTEQASKSAELPLSSPIPMQLSAQADDTQSAPAEPPPIKDDNITQIPVTDNNPASAQDSDLIEQEWVHKAKAIVENTKNDPYMQNKEINKIKADYIKKRYNKEIKVSSD